MSAQATALGTLRDVLTRSGRYPSDPGTPIHVIIAPTLVEGLRAVGSAIPSPLENLIGTDVRIHTHIGRITSAGIDLHTVVDLLGIPGDATWVFAGGGADDFPADHPRVEITVADTAWAPWQGDHASGRMRYTADRHFEIRVSPPGVDPRVHETSETLIWDAHDAGDTLTYPEALALAEAIHSRN